MRPISQVPGEMLSTFSTHRAAFSRSQRVPCGAKKGGALVAFMHAFQKTTSRAEWTKSSQLLSQLREELLEKKLPYEPKSWPGNPPSFLQTHVRDIYIYKFHSAAWRWCSRNPRGPAQRFLDRNLKSLGNCEQIIYAWYQWLFLVPVKGGLGGIVHPPSGSIYHLYATYHLLREPETTIDDRLPSTKPSPFVPPKNPIDEIAKVPYLVGEDFCGGIKQLNLRQSVNL